MTTSDDEVVVADFGAGCKIVGTRQEGETDKDVQRRFAIYKRDLHEKRKEAAHARRRFFSSLQRWQPPGEATKE